MPQLVRPPTGLVGSPPDITAAPVSWERAAAAASPAAPAVHVPLQFCCHRDPPLDSAPCLTVKNGGSTGGLQLVGMEAVIERMARLSGQTIDGWR